MDDGSVKIQSGININIKRTDGEYDRAGDLSQAHILIVVIPLANLDLLIPDTTGDGVDNVAIITSIVIHIGITV